MYASWDPRENKVAKAHEKYASACGEKAVPQGSNNSSQSTGILVQSEILTCFAAHIHRKKLTFAVYKEPSLLWSQTMRT